MKSPALALLLTLAAGHLAAQTPYVWAMHRPQGSSPVAGRYTAGFPITTQTYATIPNLLWNGTSYQAQQFVREGGYAYALYKPVSNWRLVKYRVTASPISFAAEWNRPVPQVNNVFFDEFAVHAGVIYGLHAVFGPDIIGRYDESTGAALPQWTAPQVGTTSPTEIDVDNGRMYLVYRNPANVMRRYDLLPGGGFGNLLQQSLPLIQSTRFYEFAAHDGVIYGLHEIASGSFSCSTGAVGNRQLRSYPENNINCIGIGCGWWYNSRCFNNSQFDDVTVAEDPFIGSVSYAGNACAGTLGLPTLTHSGQARFGDTLSLQLGNAPPSLPGTFAWSYTTANTDLTPGGATGCWLLVNQPSYGAIVINANGGYTLPIYVPYDRSLIGLPVHAQFGVWDSGANPAGVITTRRITAIFGNR